MAIKLHHKLVRDGIPATIEANGDRCGFRTIEHRELSHALKAKLLEEVMEYSEDPTIAELADVWEVLHALMAHTVGEALVKEVAKEKRKKVGAFDNGIYLIWTEDGEKPISDPS